MFTKKAVVISTTAGTGASHAITPIRRTLAYWGVPYIKTYGIAVQASRWSEVGRRKRKKIQKDMRILARKLQTVSCGKPSLYIRMMFGMMALYKKKNPEAAPAETAYWREQGWLDGIRPWRD